MKKDKRNLKNVQQQQHPQVHKEQEISQKQQFIKAGESVSELMEPDPRDKSLRNTQQKQASERETNKVLKKSKVACAYLSLIFVLLFIPFF